MDAPQMSCPARSKPVLFHLTGSVEKLIQNQDLLLPPEYESRLLVIVLEQFHLGISINL